MPGHKNRKGDAPPILRWYLRGTKDIVARVKVIRNGKARMEWKTLDGRTVEKVDMEKR